MGLFWDRSKDLKFCDVTFQTLHNRNTINFSLHQNNNTIRFGCLLGNIRFNRYRDLDEVIKYFREAADFLEHNVL